jgi:3-deoxy-D-manno-octulosonic-acid transferase
MSRQPLLLRAYRVASALTEPLAPLLLDLRGRRGKEDASRLGERLGRTRLERPPGPLAWVHAVSVGESLSVLPLLERLAGERPDLNLLVTSSTRTSAELLARRLPPAAIHQFAPIDGPQAVRRFLHHWRPDVGVFAESELWPNLLTQARTRGVRLALVDARLSASSMRAWGRVPASARAVLGAFETIWAQDGRTRDWLEGLGTEVAGIFDLKRLGAPLPVDEAELRSLRRLIGDRKVLTGASTHPGEEVLIADALGRLGAPGLLVLVPRHPERGAEVAASLAGAGWRVARRSAGEAPLADVDIYLADTLGELGLFYRLADICIVGGSFLEGLSGHNPLEPARLGRPVISGPHVDSFADAYAELADARAVLMAKDPGELDQALKALLEEPALARALGRRAKAAASAGGAERFERLWADLMALAPGA